MGASPCAETTVASRIEGENHASCHREALARQIRGTEKSTRRTNHQRCDGGSELRRRVRLGRDGGGRTGGLGGAGLQARHREQAGAALQEAGIRAVRITVTVSITLTASLGGWAGIRQSRPFPSRS